METRWQRFAFWFGNPNSSPFLTAAILLGVGVAGGIGGTFINEHAFGLEHKAAVGLGVLEGIALALVFTFLIDRTNQKAGYNLI
jgi:hypothetical protein